MRNYIFSAFTLSTFPYSFLEPSLAFLSGSKCDAAMQVSPEQEEGLSPASASCLRWGWESRSPRASMTFFLTTFKKKYRRFSDENSLFLLWRKAPNHYRLNTILPYDLLWVARSEGITQGGSHSQTGESCLEEPNRAQQCFQASDDEWTLRGTQASHRPGRAVLGVHI